MKLELIKEYSPILNCFMYRILKDGSLISSCADLDAAKKGFGYIKEGLSVPQEIILSEEIEEKKWSFTNLMKKQKGLMSLMKDFISLTINGIGT